jgi:hypothetical protein
LAIFRDDDGRLPGSSDHSDIEFLPGGEVRFESVGYGVQKLNGRYRINESGRVEFDVPGSNNTPMRLWRDERSLVLTYDDDPSERPGMPYRAIHPLEEKRAKAEQ